MSDQTKKRRKFKKRYVFIPLILVVVIGGAITSLFGYKLYVVQQDIGCSTATIKKASTGLVPADEAILESATTEIKKSPDYAKNVDCMYIVAYYTSRYGVAADANDALSKLQQAYDDKKGYGAEISPYAYSPQELKDQQARRSEASDLILKQGFEYAQ